MNARSIVVWFTVLVLFIPAPAPASCPVRETAILYINGIDTTKESAGKSMQMLEEGISNAPGVNPDCVVYDYAYNTNEPLFADFLEASIQKTDELNQTMSDFWRFFFRAGTVIVDGATFGTTSYFLNADNLIAVGRFLLGDQRDEHIAKYREHLEKGRQVILVSHSQGNLYANEEWTMLTGTEQSNAHIVAVATPAGLVVDGGPYTTLQEDGVAKYLFRFALPANAANEEPCGDDWTCHGFKESYLHGAHSRQRIVDEIVALLPVPVSGGRLEGIVRYGFFGSPTAGVTVQVLDFRTEAVLWEELTDASGHYVFVDVTPGIYALLATLGDEMLGYVSFVRIEKGGTIQMNLPIAVPY